MDQGMSEHTRLLSVISTQRMLADAINVWVGTRPELNVTSTSIWDQDSAWPTERGAQLRLLILTPWDKVSEQCLKSAKGQPKLRTLVLSTTHDALWMQLLLRDHAMGYVTAEQSLVDLEVAIGHVIAGDTYVPQRYVKDLMVQAASKMPHLSNREKLIAKLLVSGESHQAIAEQLHISIKTVSSHKTNIIERLGLRNLPELVRFHDTHPFFFKANPKKTRRSST